MEIKNLTGLEKPLEKLIESVAIATGVIYEPTKIVRRAKAEAEAALIFSTANEQRSELARRAASRIGYEEVRRQQNIEAIVDEAAKALPNAVLEEPVGQDWINFFFGECKDVSDAEMQSIWGKILAGEVASPGKFSRRALALLKTFSRLDAGLLEKIAPFVFRIETEGLGFIPADSDFRALMEKNGISTGMLLHLGTLGLVGTDNTLRYEVNGGGSSVFLYGKKSMKIFRQKNSLYSFPIWTVSIVALELISIVENEGGNDFIDLFTKKHAQEIGCLVGGGSK